MKTSFGIYRRLLDYAKPYWTAFLVAALGLALISATEASFAALVKPLIDHGFDAHGSFPLWLAPTVVLGIFAVRGVASFCATYSMSWVAQNVLRDLRQAMFERLLHLPSKTYDKSSSGQWISKVVTEVNGVMVAVTNVLNTLIRDSLILVGLLIWLFILNWQLTLIVFSVVPLLIVITLKFSQRMRNLSRGALTASSDLTKTVEESVYGHKLIKLYGAQPTLRDRFGFINRRFRAQNLKLVIAQALQSPLSQMAVALAVSVILVVALSQARVNQMTAGSFVSYVTALLMMLGPIRHLTDINSQLQRGLAAAEAVFSVLDQGSEARRGSPLPSRTDGCFEFRDVTFGYMPDRDPILKNLCLVLPHGQTLAIVGPSGSGKSTILELMMRFYEPQSGAIFLDGEDIRTYTLESYRSLFSYVSQDTILLNDSIAANLRIAKPSATDVELRDCLEKACLWDFVSSLPNAQLEQIGDKGVQLSGGQRQRMAIARAFLRDSAILVLDEATSALDSVSERAVHESIHRLKTGRTTVIVAHRMETIRQADQILVISDGGVVESGTHDGLVEKSGLYAALYGTH